VTPQTQGWRDLPGVWSEAAAELRRSGFSSPLSCLGEDFGGTSQKKFVQTQEEPAGPHCQGQGGHPGVPSSSLICAWYSFLCRSGPSGTAEMVRDAPWETHAACTKPQLGLGCGDRGVAILTLLFLLF